MRYGLLHIGKIELMVDGLFECSTSYTKLEKSCSWATEYDRKSFKVCKDVRHGRSTLFRPLHHG
jgi:hypothetical protein